MNPVATFEKVSFDEFCKKTYGVSPEQMNEKTLEGFKTEYDDIKLPTRATSGSAGYDFYMPCNVSVISGFDVIIASGIRVKLEPGWMLMLVPRSGLGFKHGVRLKNTVGIIDSDYYNADNEGHIMAKLVADEGETFALLKGDRFMQGILVPYGIASNDTVVSNDRVGGFGSTGR